MNIYKYFSSISMTHMVEYLQLPVRKEAIRITQVSDRIAQTWRVAVEREKTLNKCTVQ